MEGSSSFRDESLGAEIGRNSKTVSQVVRLPYFDAETMETMKAEVGH